MNRVGNQARVLAALIETIRPFWRTDKNLPVRIETAIKADKRFGSRDRRLYRELLYTAVRYLPWVEGKLAVSAEEATRMLGWLAADTAATRAFREDASQGLPPLPPTLPERAAILGQDLTALFPAWIGAECPEAVISPEADRLRTRAPLWIRLQTPFKNQVQEEFTANNWGWSESTDLPGAVRVSTEYDITQSESFEAGLFEVQDIGSQAILASAGIEPGGRWLDACAGAGGKSLQLALLLGESGRVEANDVRAEALRELGRRADKAGLGRRIVRQAPGQEYDGILIDAPCSGTGTWRRAPHLIWTTQPGDFGRMAERQRRILAENAGRVRVGGRLLYATCSFCRSENEAVVTDFLAAHPGFEAVPRVTAFGGTTAEGGLRLWPSALDGDAYFVASLRRKA